jgi:hypothetical protein
VQSLLEVVIGNDLIRVTEEHPFWVTGEGWVGAEALEPGDCVRTLAGTCQEVVSVQLASADIWVYNLTVATAHTYFVGNCEYLVHNRCSVPGSPKPSVTNPDLRKIVDSAYLPGAIVGPNGSTADAIRRTKATGELVKGSDHIQKGIDLTRRLRKWLKRAKNNRYNPPSPSDIAAAQAVLDDLVDALSR